MVKGMIYEVEGKSKTYYYHPFVYWGDRESDGYIGVMLTSTAQYYSNNIPMEDSDFESGFQIQNKNSKFVSAKLIKSVDSLKLIHVGKLTKKGIKSIDDEINNLKEVTWDMVKELGRNEK